MSSPTQRSLKMLRDDGWFCAITEHWNQYSRTRNDLFGFIDLLAIRGNETLAVQTTSGDNVSARIEKIRGIQAARLWLESPGRKIHVHGWRKVGAKGKRKLWECREVKLGLVQEEITITPLSQPVEMVSGKQVALEI